MLPTEQLIRKPQQKQRATKLNETGDIHTFVSPHEGRAGAKEFWTNTQETQLQTNGGTVNGERKRISAKRSEYSSGSDACIPMLAAPRSPPELQSGEGARRCGAGARTLRALLLAPFLHVPPGINQRC